MKRSAGFTILELMIVIALLAILLVAAVPSFLNARKNAAAAGVIGRMKTTVTANEQFHLRFRTFAASETEIINAGFLLDYTNDPDPSYLYTYSGGLSTWSMIASPTELGVTGDHYFYVDHTGVIRFESTGVATAASPPVD